MRRFCLIFFVLSTFYLILAPQVSAAGEFSMSYDNFYEVDQNLEFNVRQNVKITNLTTQYYVAELTIAVGNVKIGAVTATDETGLIPASVNFTGSQSLIKLKFKTPTVGKGQVKSLTINYSAPELVNRVGRILEVSVPKLATSENIDQFNVTLTVPTSLGPAAFISPEPVNSQSGGFGGKTSYFFDKEKLLLSGVTAAFGEKQVFSFNLTYHLQNPKSVKTEIALPSDNSYQKVLIEKIDPAPLNVHQDPDGNWLAEYELKGGKPKDIQVTGAVAVYPQPKFKSQKPGDLKKYLQPAQYWETTDDYFREKMEDLKTPRQIYDFVTSFLSYNPERLQGSTVERLGALAATQNPGNAICMEFTDLFITMARAAGIAAREVNGFAASSNERLRPRSLANFGGDILHAWPEYWDETTQTWIQVDPTWGTTSGGLDYFSKMDFAHIAFVHKGLSSTYPVSAGGYKVDPGKSGDVKVEVRTDLPQGSFEPKLSINLPKRLLSGIATEARVTIKNSSNQALSLEPLRLKVSNLILRSPAEIEVGVLPPASIREIKITVDSVGLLTNGNGKVEAFFGPLTDVAEVQIRPSLIYVLIAALGSFVILAAAFLSSILITKKLSGGKILTLK